MAAAGWEQLPVELRKDILQRCGSPAARRVCIACRDMYDAMNDKLRITKAHSAAAKAAARKALLRMAARSPAITCLSMKSAIGPANEYVSLGGILAAGASVGLAGRLRKVLNVCVHSQGAAQQLQALQQCTSLTHLQLHSMWSAPAQPARAYALSEALGRMPHLTHLDLHSFVLQQLGAVQLAPGLIRLTQLQHLCLARVGMRPAGLAALALAISAMTGLQALDLSGNGIAPCADLTAALKNKPQLTRLDLSENTMGGIDFDSQQATSVHLVGPLRVLGQLQHLLLSSASLCDEDIAHFLLPTLPALPHLKTLDLGHNHLSAREARALCPALLALTNLQSLNLCHICPDFCSARPDLGFTADRGVTLLGSPQLHCMLLEGEGNGIPQPGARPPPATQLHSPCGSNSPLSQTPAAAHPAAAAGGRSLQDLALLNMTPEAGAAIAPALAGLCLQAYFSSLTTLKISYVRLGAQGAADFAPVLATLTGLTRLHLSCCGVGAWADRLAPALGRMRQLQVLSLDANGLGPEGAAALAPALEEVAGTLQRLSLQSNDLGTRGMAALAAAFAGMRRLQVLQLAYNDLGRPVADMLVPLLRKMPLMRSLDLLMNSMGARASLAVAKALAGRDRHVSVHLVGSVGFSDEETSAIDQLRGMSGLDVLW